MFDTETLSKLNADAAKKQQAQQEALIAKQVALLEEEKLSTTITALAEACIRKGESLPNTLPHARNAIYYLEIGTTLYNLAGMANKGGL